MGLSFAFVVYLAYDGGWFGLGAAVDPVDGLVNTGATATEKYLTGYVVEKSLSVDNIFVIAMIFGFFAVPPLYQHRVLFWGILGALVLRGAMIGIGAALIAKYHWVLYLFALFLIATAIKMLVFTSETSDPGKNPVIRLARRLFPVTADHHGARFVVKSEGKLFLTPLALALVMVETTDLIFAVDSIPAVFAITGDPFLVFTSNVFAILGLRSLYFALAGMVQKFRYLKVALAAILLVVGVKMLAAEWLKGVLGERFNVIMLAVVLGILAAGVVSSLWADRRDAAA
jgi:tellurite resistance protein TerC